ncbi:hypothetical protein FRC11_008676 [Ceratobasidium sp. 423]|nr:hypothetical protein FRC11_008676 [Ceratobasidium sp. 423]
MSKGEPGQSSSEYPQGLLPHASPTTFKGQNCKVPGSNNWDRVGSGQLFPAHQVLTASAASVMSIASLFSSITPSEPRRGPERQPRPSWMSPLEAPPPCDTSPLPEQLTDTDHTTFVITASLNLDKTIIIDASPCPPRVPRLEILPSTSMALVSKNKRKGKAPARGLRSSRTNEPRRSNPASVRLQRDMLFKARKNKGRQRLVVDGDGNEQYECTAARQVPGPSNGSGGPALSEPLLLPPSEPRSNCDPRQASRRMSAALSALTESIPTPKVMTPTWYQPRVPLPTIDLNAFLAAERAKIKAKRRAKVNLKDLKPLDQTVVSSALNRMGAPQLYAHPGTIKRIYYNENQRENKSNDKEGAPASLPKQGGVSTLNLFKQRYKERIKACRDELMAAGQYPEKLQAYNAAVKVAFKAFQEEDIEEYEKLQELAEKMKTTHSLEFDEQEFETKEAVLEMLPVELAHALNNWQRRTGACIYLMAVWAQPGGGLGMFDYATKNCGRFLKSGTCTDIRDQWHEWMKSEKGAVLTGNIEDAQPAIYPDENGFPQYPDLSDVSVNLTTQVRLLRRYFTLVAIAMGGVAPSYERISEDMKNGTRVWIRPECFPAGCMRFDDPKWWPKTHANAWGFHLVAGQNKSLPPHKRFCYALLPGARGTTRGPAPAFVPVPVPGAQIHWTTEELMYAEKIKLCAPSRAVLDAAYRDLPPARCSHVYQPFKVEVFQQVAVVHKSHAGMIDLFREIALMEELGPIQNTVGFSDSARRGNPHVPHSREISLAKEFLPAGPLPLEFFDSYHPKHPDWSPQGFKNWLAVQQPHVHKESGTTYGGPRGVRKCAMAVSRMWQNVEYVEDGSLPAEIRPKVQGPNQTWKDELTRETLDSIVEILRRDVARSRTILMVTFPQRAELWRQGVHQRLTEARENPEDPVFSTPDRGISATSGIPNYVPLLEEMSAAIEQPLATHKASNEDYDVSQVLELRAEQLVQALRVDNSSEPVHEDFAPQEPGTLSSSRADTPHADTAVESDADEPDTAPISNPKRRGKQRARTSVGAGTRSRESARRKSRGQPSTRGSGRRGRRRGRASDVAG